MTTIGIRRRASRTAGRPFYLIMSLVMAAVIVIGFSQTVPGDFAPTPGLPLLLHVHGAIFTLWVFLFVAQPAFIVRGSLKLHRQVGMLGAALAGAMVVMGLAATLFSIRHHMVPSFFPPGIFLVMNSLGILVFGGLVCAGVALRRQTEWHKRLMLCATVTLLAPALGRALPMDSFGDFAPLVMFAVVLVFALIGPAYDLMSARRIHPAYIWGVATIVTYAILIPPLGFSGPIAGLLGVIRSV